MNYNEISEITKRELRIKTLGKLFKEKIEFTLNK